MTDGPPPQHRVFYRNVLSGRYNQLQLGDEVKVGYRYRLYRSDSPAVWDNFIGAGVTVVGTPGGTVESVHLEFAPATFLQLSVSADFWQWFGNFNYIQSWQYADQNWGPTEVARLGALPATDSAKNYQTTGLSVTSTAFLQGKVGPVVLRSANRLIYNSYSLRPGDRVFYDSTTDFAVPNQGLVFMTDDDVAYTSGRLGVGLRFTYAQALYRSADFSADLGSNPNVPLIRLGPTVSWRFFEDRQPHFNPALALVTGWYLSHRFRTGADVSQAIPYVSLNFLFWGDLLNVPLPKDR